MNAPLTAEPLRGEKGKSGSGGGTPREVDDNLLSDSTAYILGVISEGEIEGLANADDPEACIFLDGTPLRNADGSYNFENVQWWLRSGLPDQDPVPGFSAVETETDVSAKIEQALPVSRSVSAPEVDAVRVKLSVPALVEVTDEGDRIESAVQFKIEVQAGAAAFEEVRTETITGKTTSGYQRTFRIELPDERPATIRVTRLTPDSDSTQIQNDLYFASLTEIIDARLSYPNTALLGLAIPARSVGGSVRRITVRVKGVRCLVPSNYDPVARSYDESAMWDGTFKLAWHRNPMWALYNTLVNDRWGLGARITPGMTDKWAAYEIAKYCDEPVPDGQGGLEPRFSIDGPMSTREAAHAWVQRLSAAFRGVTYWGAGAVVPVQDAPSDPVRIVTNSDVEMGRFSYSGTPRSQRHTTAVVTLRDGDDHFRMKPLVSYDDPAAVERYGEQLVELTSPFTVSRGEGLRQAKWAVDTDTTQAETVRFTGGMAFHAIRPGDVLLISDKHRVGHRRAGRIAAVDAADRVTLDGPVSLPSAQTHTLLLTDDTGDLVSRSVLTTGSDLTQLTLDRALPANVVPGARFIVQSSNLAPREFRVLANRPDDRRKTFEISALLNDPAKFARVEEGIEIETAPGHLLPDIGPPSAPAGVTLEAYLRPRPGARSQLILLAGWHQHPDPLVQRHRVEINEPGAPWRVVGEFRETDTEITPIRDAPGIYRLRVYAIKSLGQLSGYVEVQVDTAATRPAPSQPTGWQGTAGVDAITLSGDPHPASDFKCFVIYGATADDPALIRLDEIATTRYVRRPPVGDAITRYRVSALNHNNDESALTGFIEVVPLVETSTDDPDVPAGLALTSALISDGVVRATALWDANPGAGVVYEVELTLDGGNPVLFAAASNTYEWSVLPGQALSVRVRARNPYSRISAWSAPVAHTAATDTTPPATPTGLSVTAGFGTLWLEWTANTEADLSHYEISVVDGDVAPSPPPFASHSATGTNLVLTGLGTEVKCDFNVRAIDTSGNASSWSTAASGRTTALEPLDIEGIVDLTSFAAGLTGVEVVSKLPTAGNFEGRTAVLTTDGKLYRYTGGKWSRKVDGADLILDSVTTGALAAGAVKAEQIDAKAVTAAKMLLADTSNLVDNAGFEQADAGWILTGNCSVVSGGSPHTGNSQLKCEGTGVGAARSERRFEVSEGDRFFLSYWMKASSTAASNRVGVRINWRDYANTYVGAAYVDATGLTTAWQKFSGEVTAPAGAAFAEVSTIVIDQTAGGYYWDDIYCMRRNAGELLVDGAIRAKHLAAEQVITLSAQIKNAIITDAKIANLSATKLIAGTALTTSLTVSGTALSTINSRAENPAARINQKTTQIDPGKIVISGGTSLADWRMGGDETKIDGGNIAANTINANKVSIGLRGVSAEGFDFQTSGNTLSWSSGNIRYLDNTGTYQVSAVGAGSASYTGARLYLTWSQGASSLVVRTSAVNAHDGNRVVLAIYNGGSDLTTQVGRTIIDGDHIKTGTVDAIHLKAAAVTVDKLASGQGRNLLSNADFSQGDDGWTVEGGNGAVHSELEFARLRDAGTQFAGATYPTYQIKQNGTATDGWTTIGVRRPVDSSPLYVPVNPGDWYGVSAYVWSLRCEFLIQVTWRDDSAAILANTWITSKTTATSGDTYNPNTWDRLWGKAQAPAGATFAHIRFVKYGTLSGSDSHLFIHKPMLSETHAEATGPAPWDTGAMTMIDGPNIRTGSIITATLESTDYVQGSAGFRLASDGSLEIQNLIERDALISGSVSDGLTATQSTAVEKDHNEIVLAATSIGPVAIDQFWHFALVGEIRRLGIRSDYVSTNDSYNHNSLRTALRLQHRVKDGGTWGSWVTDWTSTLSGVNTWSSPPRNQTVHFQGNHQDVEIRVLCLIAEDGAGNSVSDLSYTQTNFRNVGLVAQSVMR